MFVTVSVEPEPPPSDPTEMPCDPVQVMSVTVAYVDPALNATQSSWLVTVVEEIVTYLQIAREKYIRRRNVKKTYDELPTSKPSVFFGTVRPASDAAVNVSPVYDTDLLPPVTE